MENSIILLNKDGSVKITNKEKKIFKHNPLYILIPISCVDNISYVFIKNKKLLDFTYADIRITMTCVINYDEEEIYFNSINKKITSVVELINFIHSINRIEYINTLTSRTCTDFHTYIKVSDISLVLYKDNKITFSLSESDLGDNYETLGLIREIYELMNNNLVINKEYYDYLIIRDNKWKFSNKISNNSLVGLNLSLSHSIYFVKSIEFDEIRYTLRNITFEGYIYHINEINKLIMGEDLFESEDSIFCNYCYQSIGGNFNSKEAVIEFLVYTNYLYNTMMLLYNDILYGYDKYKDNKYVGFDIYLSFNINSNIIGADETISYNNNLTYSKLSSPRKFVLEILNKLY